MFQYMFMLYSDLEGIEQCMKITFVLTPMVLDGRVRTRRP